MNSIEYKRKIAEEASKYLEECLGKAGVKENNSVEEEDDGQTIFSPTLCREYGLEAARKESPMGEPRESDENDEDVRTADFSSGVRKDYFVTGWLVCIEGSEKGHSYNLYHGYNTIGRSPENQICISGDDAIHSKVHCTVVYEGRNSRFYLLPQEDSQTFLEEAEVTKPEQMKDGDTLLLGGTKLVFVPFCIGERKWNRKEMREFLQRENAY